MDNSKIRIFFKEDDLRWLSPVTERIAAYICQKALQEMVRHDHNRMTMLGNCSYWIQNDPNTGDALLCYTIHPKQWDMTNILIDLELGERAIMIAKGVDMMGF